MPGILPWFRGLVLAAFCAGLAGGAGLSVLHHVLTSPLIAQAEAFEVAAPPSGHPPGAAHASVLENWHRTALTGLADLWTGIGFALILCAGLVLRGGRTSLWEGLLWGLAGFASFSLAPALGLPPELPGTEIPPILPRQIWWVATALATAGGLALLVFTRRIGTMAGGVALLIAPHLLGAPRLGSPASVVPEELTRLFLAAAMASNLIFWLLLGLACVLALRRFVPMTDPSVR